MIGYEEHFFSGSKCFGLITKNDSRKLDAGILADNLGYQEHFLFLVLTVLVLSWICS